MYLENIQSVNDLKALDVTQLQDLSKEIRSALLTKLSTRGGHIGPNLGMVEMTVAMHYVFSSPTDKMVYDVSHQSYVHKMLTGRKDAFLDPSKYASVSGYTNPNESEHDFFIVGHTSTSISLASGLAKARDVKQGNENIIAIIGDGSLSGGEAYEGLNNVAQANTNCIIVVNDNEMSIAENAGGLYQNLQALRDSKGTCENNFFTALGLGYTYVEDGHDLETLIRVFNKVKDTPTPIVVHIHTTKGKGYSYAEQNKEPWHYFGPFDIESGQPKFEEDDATSYESITAQFVETQCRQDKSVVAITSGTPSIFGLPKEPRDALGSQFIDVGIAEEHAIAYASGLASQGGKPIYAVYSTFLQRTYDQISHDLCLNNNPALVLIYAASVYGMNDNTHIGLFDIGMLSNIPNLVYLAPTNKEEYEAMLHWGLHQQDHPVFIRVPATSLVSTGKVDITDYDNINTYETIHKGKEVAIIASGNFFSIGQQVIAMLKEKGMNPTLINPKYLSGLDEVTLSSLQQDHSLVITLEDGIIDGGFGERIARYYGPTSMKVKVYGLPKYFHDRFSAETLLEENRITPSAICEDIRTLINK